MSNMSILYTLIQERFECGEDPVSIADALDIPVSWVYEAVNNISKVPSPFKTDNS